MVPTHQIGARNLCRDYEPTSKGEVEGGEFEPLTGESSVLWGEHEGASWRFVGRPTIILDNAPVLTGFL